MNVLKLTWAKFLLLAALIYLSAVALFNLKPVESVFNTMIIKLSDNVLSVVLLDAQIDVQTGKNDKKRFEPNIMQVNFSWTKEQIDKMTQKALEQKVENISVPHRFTKYYIYQFFTIPLILFFALFMATPFDSALTKLKIVMSGLLLLVILLWLKLFLLVLFSISNSRIGIYELGDTAMKILVKLASIWTMEVSILFVLLLWGILALPKSKLYHNFSRLFQVNTK